MNLRIAIILSSLLHIMALVPCSIYFASSRPAEKRYPLELNYFRITEDKKKETGGVARSEAKKALEQAAPEPQKSHPANESVVKPPQAETVKPPKEAKPALARSDAATSQAPPQEAPRASEAEKIVLQKVSVSYNQIIREKIRRSVKARYNQATSKWGDIYLEFTVDKAGNLINFLVDMSRSSHDEALLRIVEASLKEASPFPPLPDSVKRQRLTFNILISFKER